MKKTILFLLLLCVTSQVGAYEFNWKEYNIKVPENMNFWERSVMTNNCKMSKYECKFAYANILLIKKWFNPLYK